MDHDFVAALGVLKRRAEAADLAALASIIETLELEEQEADLEPTNLDDGAPKV